MTGKTSKKFTFVSIFSRSSDFIVGGRDEFGNKRGKKAFWQENGDEHMVIGSNKQSSSNYLIEIIIKKTADGTDVYCSFKKKPVTGVLVGYFEAFNEYGQ